MILYFVDDYVNIIGLDKVFKKRIEKGIDKGIIKDKKVFGEEFLKVLKKEKIKNKVWRDKIKVVKNSFFNERDLYYIGILFEELGFLGVEYIEIRDLLPDDNRSYIEINNSYMVINIDRETSVMIDFNCFKDIPDILDYFKNDLGNVF